MSEDYLDITKSVMISSPAGSGKTEKLARRYIVLLRGGSDVERILAITFTDKAAAEMKERILNILRNEDPVMFEAVREKMPRMRISTIHSFCLKMLRRFCLELGMDPSLEVMDSFNSDMLWEEAVYESLLEDGLSEEGQFYEVIKNYGVKGWNKLHTQLKYIHNKRPGMESGVRGMGMTLDVGTSSHLEKIISIYSGCLDSYRKKKLQRHRVDYNDLELMAYEAISENPEWQNVLYSFDEHTDHILVDEFQDTSILQWLIIDKLTEEWRSGLGAKRDSGVTPTIFLVGDNKQSIYSFRGANAGIFRDVRNKLEAWLGEECHFIEVKENYRSLPAIVEFVNNLFEKLMPATLYKDRRVEYVPFEPQRQGDGMVELVICDGIGNTKENRKAEAAVVAGKIKKLLNTHEIYDGSEKRACRFGDMAILLRNRTHLSTFEDALMGAGIPFVVVKGIGFYSAPEVGILRDLLFFLIDPQSDYSLFNILRSPVFSMKYDSILELVKEMEPDELPVGYLYDMLKSTPPLIPPLGRGGEGGGKKGTNDILRGAIASLDNWIGRAKTTPYAILLEEILAETGAWKYFHEKQRYVNVKKFIRLVEDMEAKGLSGLEIREKLIKASGKSDESKANVNTEGMDAVQIMTVHASKGLQFPIVIFPCLDEGVQAKTGSIVMDEDSNKIIIAYEEDSGTRKTIPAFAGQREKIEDEEKRLFYVAATRARDYLCVSGVLNKKPSGKLAYVWDAFNLNDRGEGCDNVLPFGIERMHAVELLELLNAGKDISRREYQFEPSHLKNEPVFIEPLDKAYKPFAVWRDVTEETDDIRSKHGDDWVVLGRVFHSAFEGISKGYITGDNLESKITGILKNNILSDSDVERMKGTVMSGMERLDKAGYIKEIMLPRENSYAELPFLLEQGQSIYKGRMDRVIIKDDTAHIYDYKTYPVSEGEIPELKRIYSFQMDIYKKAVERLFSIKTKAYLFFTHELKIVELP